MCDAHAHLAGGRPKRQSGPAPVPPNDSERARLLDGELDRHQDAHLSKIQGRFENELLRGGQENPVSNVTKTKTLADQIAWLNEFLESSIAAATQQRPPKSGYEGCRDNPKGSGKGTGLARPDHQWLQGNVAAQGREAFCDRLG